MVKRLVNRLRHSKFATNTGWIMMQQIVHMLLSLVVGMLSARYLGPSNYGIIHYATSFVTLFTSMATLGMDSVIVKALIDEPDREGTILGSCILLRTVSGFLCSVAIVLIVWVLNPGETATVVVAILCSISLIFKSFELLDCWFQRYLASKYTSIAKIIAYVVVSAYQAVLLLSAKSVHWFALATSLDYLVMAVILLVFYRRQGKSALAIDLRTGLNILKGSYHFIISGLMVSLYGQMDKMMLKSMVDAAAVGLYSTANYICTMWIFIPTALINSARPIIMSEKKNNPGGYLYRLEQLYSGIIWLCIFVSAFVSLFGSFIIFILYGRQYAGAIDALKVLIWCETFSMIGTARGIWIVSEGKNKYVKYYLVYGVIVNAALNYLLIPVMGIVGASIATLVTQFVTAIIAPLFYKETRIHTKYVLEAFIFKWFFDQERRVS